MAQAGKLPQLSKREIESLRSMGFRPITGRPFDYIGLVKSQLEGEHDMAALLTVVPLKIKRGHYIVSLQMNGETMVNARMVVMEDIANLVGYSGFMKDVLSITEKETHGNDNATDD